MAVFVGHTPLTEKMAIHFFFFFNNMSKKMGFIRVIYANYQNIMAIRANTAKYGSLTGKKKKKKKKKKKQEKQQPYGVPGTSNHGAPNQKNIRGKLNTSLFLACSFFGSVHVYWGSAKNRQFSQAHTKSRDVTYWAPKPLLGKMTRTHGPMFGDFSVRDLRWSVLGKNF